jgi:heterodisulfide reductase subunit C2
MESTGTAHAHTSKGLSGLLKSETGVDIITCYQCGKCSAGCPLVEEMDIPPSQVMRMIQTGRLELEEKILRSYTIWVCVTCNICYGRCPMEIDIPRVMDYLREKAIREKKFNPKARRIIAFHKSFLNSIRFTGRLHEISLYAWYKMLTLTLFQDLAVAPGFLKRGKLSILPEMVKGRKNIAGIFSKTINRKKE